MMHFRLDGPTQERILKACSEHPQRFDSQSALIRKALKYYLNRLEAGVLDQERDREPEPQPPPAPDIRHQRPVPPPRRSRRSPGDVPATRPGTCRLIDKKDAVRRCRA